MDAATANREVTRWLSEIANVRIHATLLEKPADRWEREREKLLPLPRPYQGVQLPREDRQVVRQLIPSDFNVIPTESWQHPLTAYQDLAWEVRA